MAERDPSTPRGPEGPNVGELIDAAFGWNARMLRGALGAFLNPVAVCTAALAGDDDRYASPVRIFILLFGVSLAISALAAGGQMFSMQGLSSAPSETLDRWAAASGTSVSQVDEVIGGWSGILAWPLMIISASPYIFLLKAYTPSRTLFGHVLVYIVTNNAAIMVQILLVPAMALLVEAQTNMIWSTVVVMGVYLVTSARVIFALYSGSLLGGAAKFLGLLLLTPISIGILGVLQFISIEVLLQVRFDLSLIELMAITSGDAA